MHCSVDSGTRNRVLFIAPVHPVLHATVSKWIRTVASADVFQTRQNAEVTSKKFGAGSFVSNKFLLLNSVAGPKILILYPKY